MKPAACLVALLLVGLFPVAAFAPPAPSGQNTSPTQSNISNAPNDFPTPTQPWYGLPSPNRGAYGSVVGSIEVPPRQVAVPVYVPGPGSFSGEYRQQVVEIPGYVVTETTTGYIYPERWGLQEQTAGVYQWVRLPPVFQAK